MPDPELLLASKRCSECLTTASRIVSGERAAEIIRQCRDEDNHFLCHKSPEGQIIHCRGVHDALDGSRAYRMALHYDFRIRLVDPDDL